MFKFNPLSISSELKDMYKNFILSSFPMKNIELKKKLENSIDNEKLLWNGPFISISSKYKKGQKSREFLKECNFEDILIEMMEVDKFYLHQEEAINSIIEDNNTVVSTGTGSGKTETFILPILDYCLKHREKGLKAIIVYPMNALANDQMLRLRTLLYKINSNLSEPVTISKYIGQTPNNDGERELEKIPLQKCKVDNTILGPLSIHNCPSDCDQIKLKAEIKDKKARLVCKDNHDYNNNFEILTRKDIRENPPDILITNYVQLEYLLLRREDSPIFQSPKMKFLVFDEVHWYSGARGAEVSLLIRRLKSRINKYTEEKIISIGTSATISSAQKAKEDIARFASNIFGEDINSNNIVTGETEPISIQGGCSLPILDIPLKSQLDILKMPEEEFKSFCESFSDNIGELPEGEGRLSYIGRLLYNNEKFKNIVDSISEIPKTADTVWKEEFETLDEVVDNLNSNPDDIVWKYLYTGSIAYDPFLYEQGEREPLIKPQVHMFFKTLGERWPFGNAFTCLNCNELYTKAQEECKVCGGAVEELGVCRFCGEEFYRGIFERSPFDRSRDVLSTIGKDTTKDNLKYGLNEEGFPSWQLFKDPQVEGFIKQKKCVSCGSLISESKDLCSFCGSEELIDVFLKDIVKCPFCGNRYGRFSAVSPIYMSPNITSRLVFDLNFSLLPKEKRKMIVFSDSRQDASYMAGTIEEEHLDHLIRQILTQNVQKYGALHYNQLERLSIDEIQKMYPKLHIEQIEQKLLMEISTISGKQRSAEMLGLVLIEYEDLENIDSEQISHELKISDSAFKEFLKFVLNRIRQAGALENLHNKKLRYGAKGFICGPKKGKTHLLSVLPHPSYDNTFTLYSKKVFKEKNPIIILKKCFELLDKFDYIKEVNIGIYNNKEKGFVVNKEKLVFKIPEVIYECDKCGKVFTSAPILECPNYRCKGILVKKTPDEYFSSKDKFHIKFYKYVEPVKLKVEEDTGYIPVEKRQRYELDFRSGDVDLLVATPTLELGIDIGDLVCVGLMKAPPTPANYAQRVGRAGRESKVSMANAFMFQNPIDLYYFEYPQEIISGKVQAPILNLNNPYIIKRHINSLILEELLVTPLNPPNYYLKPFFMKKFSENNYTAEMIEDLRVNSDKILDNINSTFNHLPIRKDLNSAKLIENFDQSFENALKMYQMESEVLKEILTSIMVRQNVIISEGGKDAKKELGRLLRMLANIQERSVNLNDKEFFSHLSDSGVIPRYAFSGSSVKVISYEGKSFGERQMPIALYELAPGMPIYLGGRKNRVIGLAFDQDPEMMATTTFYVCENCGLYASEAQIFETCPECNSKNTVIEIKDCHKPSAVVIKDIGSPKEEGRESTYADTSVYLLEPTFKDVPDEKTYTKNTEIGEIKLLGKRSILSIVNGINSYEDRAMQTFNLCGRCGFHLGGDFSTVEENKHKTHPDILGKGFHEPSGILEDIKLYHKFDTTVLLLNLPSDDEIFLTTLKNALLNSALRVVGADDGEIDCIIKENNLVLYDNIEGGAGYVNTIYEKFDEVLSETRKLVLSCNCEIGCLKCLYSYRRRRDIQLIDKRKILDFIKKLQCIQVKQNILEKSKNFSESVLSEKPLFKSLSKEFHISGNSKCILSDAGEYDGAVELRDSILSAKSKVTIVSLYVSDWPVQWEDEKTFSWCDVLISCKMNDVKDLKVIVRPPKAQWEQYALQRLLNRGIEVFTFDGFDVPKGIAHSKIVIIDENTDHGTAVLQSANLSPEVIKNADFYIFLTQENNKETFPVLEDWLKNLIRRCKKFNI